jgi:hypothetical protein
MNDEANPLRLRECRAERGEGTRQAPHGGWPVPPPADARSGVCVANAGADCVPPLLRRQPP